MLKKRVQKTLDWYTGENTENSSKCENIKSAYLNDEEQLYKNRKKLFINLKGLLEKRRKIHCSSSIYFSPPIIASAFFVILIPQIFNLAQH